MAPHAGKQSVAPIDTTLQYLDIYADIQILLHAGTTSHVRVDRRLRERHGELLGAGPGG